MSQIAYLIETPHITNTGNLQSKSLRAFEVEYDASTAAHYRLKVIPTGKVFVLKDGVIIEKRTKAKLEYKYVRIAAPTSDVNVISYWGASLYTSPELALLAKAVAIKSRVQATVRELEHSLEAAKSALSYASIADEFVARYPEHLV